MQSVSNCNAHVISETFTLWLLFALFVYFLDLSSIWFICQFLCLTFALIFYSDFGFYLGFCFMMGQVNTEMSVHCFTPHLFNKYNPSYIVYYICSYFSV